MNEKRQFERILVENVWMEFPSGRYCVVDISEKAVRVLGIGEEMVPGEKLRATICFGDDGTAIKETLNCKLVRSDEAFNVFGFETPQPKWLELARGFRTIRSDVLDTSLFD